MWSDFQIGDRVSNVSASSHYSGCEIAESSEEYWWYSPEYQFGGKINKNSDVGKKITKMLEKRRKEIDNYVLQQALSVLSSRDFKKVMKRILDIQFRKGKEAKVKEILKVLTPEGLTRDY